MLNRFFSIVGDGQASEAYASGANDVVVVRQPNGELAGTPVNLQIGEKKIISFIYFVYSNNTRHFFG